MGDRNRRPSPADLARLFPPPPPPDFAAETASLTARLDAFLPALRAANEALPPPPPPPPPPPLVAAGAGAPASLRPRLDDLVGSQPVPVVVVGDDVPGADGGRGDADTAAAEASGGPDNDTSDGGGRASPTKKRRSQAGWVEMDLLYDATEHGELVGAAGADADAPRRPLIEEVAPRGGASGGVAADSLTTADMPRGGAAPGE